MAALINRLIRLPLQRILPVNELSWSRPPSS
uniref:Uncharacterized protein n=1 Tax=Anguilla anguilla TaxID=7936 RepID=A0A0E9U2T8_ANGAN